MLPRRDDNLAKSLAGLFLSTPTNDLIVSYKTGMVFSSRTMAAGVAMEQSIKGPDGKKTR